MPAEPLPTPRSYPLILCDAFPDLPCCDGCHIDWEAAPYIPDAYLHSHMPEVCIEPDESGYALVCCEIARVLRERGWRWLTVTGLAAAEDLAG